MRPIPINNAITEAPIKGSGNNDSIYRAKKATKIAIMKPGKYDNTFS